MARPTLFGHRKLKKLATRLKSKALAIGHLELMWNAANETGNPILGDADDVESAAEWQGDRGELVAALLECGSAGGPGFLETLPDGRYLIHDYGHHAPEYANGRRAKEDERRREKHCESCERPYFSTDPKSRFCSSTCRSRFHRNGGTNADATQASSDATLTPLQTPSERCNAVPTDSHENGASNAAPLHATQVRCKAAECNAGTSFATLPNGPPAPAPAPARKEKKEEFTHTQRARENADRTEANSVATEGNGQTGVRHFGTALCEIGDPTLEEWRRSVPEVNAEAFARWIAHWERNKGRRMAADVRLLQARDLGKRGDQSFQLALAEHCMRQDWGSLISNADYIRQTNGRGGPSHTNTPRKSTEQIEVEDVWRRHRAGEPEAYIAREALITVERVREILAGEEPKHAVG